MPPQIPSRPSCKAAYQLYNDINILVDRVESHLSRTTMFVFTSSQIYIPSSSTGSHGLYDIDPRNYCQDWDIYEATTPPCIGSCLRCCKAEDSRSRYRGYTDLPPIPPVLRNEPISSMAARQYLVRAEMWFRQKKELVDFNELHGEGYVPYFYALTALCNYYPLNWLERTWWRFGGRLAEHLMAYEAWKDENSSQARSWLQLVDEGRELVRRGERWLGWKEQDPLILERSKED